MNMQKYIRFSNIGFVIWSAENPTLSHAEVAACHVNAGNPISAGFVAFHNGKPKCAGESMTLGLESHPDDSALLAKQLGLE